MRRTRKTDSIPKVRVAPQVRQALERLAEQRGETLSEVVRSVLQEAAAPELNPLTRIDARLARIEAALAAVRQETSR